MRLERDVRRPAFALARSRAPRPAAARRSSRPRCSAPCPRARARRTLRASRRAECPGRRRRGRSRGRCGRVCSRRRESSRRLPDGLGAEVLEARHPADLGGHDHAVAVAAGGHPAADDRLRLAAGVARRPSASSVGGVDEVAARRRVRVEDGEGLRLVGSPAEDVAAQAEREDVEVGVCEESHAQTIQRRLGSFTCSCITSRTRAGAG